MRELENAAVQVCKGEGEFEASFAASSASGTADITFITSGLKVYQDLVLCKKAEFAEKSHACSFSQAYYINKPSDIHGESVSASNSAACLR